MDADIQVLAGKSAVSYRVLFYSLPQQLALDSVVNREADLNYE
jgi:hypothetical protein